MFSTPRFSQWLDKFLHKKIGVGFQHIPYNWTYTSAAARTSATGFKAEDIGKFARQLDDNSIWMLTAITPTWVAVGGSGGAAGRSVLTADRTYYVRTDGSDSNDGLTNTAGGAFLTVQKAINVVSALDISIYNVIIQIADGTYSGAILARGPWVGSGTVTIQGNATTPANVVLTHSVDVITCANGNALTIKDCKVVSTGGRCLYATASGYLKFGNLNIGSSPTPQLRADISGVIECISNYTISAGAAYHCRAEDYGCIRIRSKTITITGTPAFSGAFVGNQIAGDVVIDGNTFSGGATGKRYDIQMNSVCFVAGAGSTYLPGDVAGTTATGGQYA